MKASIIAVALVALATLSVAAAEAPHLQIEKLDAIVVNLAAQKLINSGQEKSLRTKLAHAAGGLQAGDSRATTQRLDTFVSEVRALQKARVLPEKEALRLTTLAEGVATQIEEITTTPLSVDPAGLQLCPTRPCKDKARLFVNAGTTAGKPDGSAENPFRTIGESMDKARFLALCAIEVVIAPGRYRETVIVDRDLILRGAAPGVVVEGSILNFEGHRLEVHGLTLLNSPSPGAIVVPFACSSTTIRDVLIDGATGYGVRQARGGLEMFRTQVRGTRGETSESSSGAGIRLSGGLRGALRLVEIEGNSGGGLLIEGLSTRVYAGGLLVRRNHINPAFREAVIDTLMTEGRTVPGVAGIEVRHGLLLLEFFGIEENQMAGLLVLDHARVAARYGVVSANEVLDLARGSFGGFGIYATDEDARNGVVVPADERTVIDLTFTSSLRNAVVGFRLSEVFATWRRMRVEHNVLGVVFAFRNGDHRELPSYTHAFNCLDFRTVRHNDTNSSIEWGYPLPLPCGLECPPVPPCREIAFVCDWCR